MLVSPDFLFRMERDPAGVEPRRRVSASADLELASRLSFFLWSSIPDDELLDARERGQAAASPTVLEQQVRRMLADPRVATRWSTNFAGQWLYLREPAPARRRTRRRFRTSTRTCARRSSARPSCSSRASCARIAASLDLLTADYTFVNERLAKHYGIPNVYGSHFRRVHADRREPRAACLARAAPDGHLVCRTGPRRRCAASGCSRTSSGTPPPPPPPDVPALKDGRRRAEAPDDARADGAAPREPGLRQLPRPDGSARLRAGELRRRRPLARRPRTGDADRRLGRPAGRHAFDGPAGCARCC